MNYTESMMILAQALNVLFDEVYFDAELVTNDKKEYFPAISSRDEWINLSPTDEREVVYIRRSGSDEVVNELKLQSCSNSYQMRTPVRVVFFKDHVNNQQQILANVTNAALAGKTKLKTIIRDKWKLLKDESSGDYNFGPDTAYFAIDTYLVWELILNSCIEDFCQDIINPLKK